LAIELKKRNEIVHKKLIVIFDLPAPFASLGNTCL